MIVVIPVSHGCITGTKNMVSIPWDIYQKRSLASLFTVPSLLLVLPVHSLLAYEPYIWVTSQI